MTLELAIPKHENGQIPTYCYSFTRIKDGKVIDLFYGGLNPGK